MSEPYQHQQTRFDRQWRAAGCLPLAPEQQSQSTPVTKAQSWGDRYAFGHQSIPYSSVPHPLVGVGTGVPALDALSGNALSGLNDDGWQRILQASHRPQCSSDRHERVEKRRQELEQQRQQLEFQHQQQWLPLCPPSLKPVDPQPTIVSEEGLWEMRFGTLPLAALDQPPMSRDVSIFSSFTPSVVSSMGGSSYSTPTTRITAVNDVIEARDYTIEAFTSTSSWSRGPSPHPFSNETTASPAPLEQLPIPPFSCANPACDTTFDTEDALARHLSLAHAFKCNWAQCPSTGFASRDGLNWHVKAEHLVICPVPGCPESSFASNLILKSHVRVAHQNIDPDTGDKRDAKNRGAKTVEVKLPNKTPEMTPPATPLESTTIPQPIETTSERTTSRSSSAAVARAIELTKLAAASKKRCREQLRRIAEKRARRANGAQVKKRKVECESPPGLVRSRTPEPVENAPFPLIWEHGVLPFLVDLMPKWCGPGFMLNVLRGKTPSSRQIAIVTKRRTSRARRILIAAHVKDLLPSAYSQSVSFMFSLGAVERAAAAHGTSPKDLDDLCDPKNPFFYKDPMMGDSIGIEVADAEGESTSTLGPCLTVGGGSYWLANFHPFLDQWQERQCIEVTHPSPKDRERCAEQGHEALDNHALDFKLGDLIATSGVDLKTTRVSHEPYWEDMCLDQQLIVTDWTLISAGKSQANLLRRFPHASARMDVPVTHTANIEPGATVMSTGRTSGFQRGQICEVPAYVDGSENGVGRATREWFVEEPEPYDNENGWVRGGIGVEGDSGAAIVDAHSNALIGQLWGRNKYWGSGPRVTYFTPIRDIFDDIQERCGQQGRPQLPQHRDEADCWPCYPVCRSCFESTSLVSSRRSSIASASSTVLYLTASQDSSSGSASDSMRGQPDSQDTGNETAFSTPPECSELAATPKDATSVACWPLGVGIGGTAGSSPLPSFTYQFASIGHLGSSFTFSSSSMVGAGSPGSLLPDAKSPYAVAIRDEDLYDAEYDEPQSSGKRPAMPLVRSSAGARKQQHKKTGRVSHESRTAGAKSKTT